MCTLWTFKKWFTISSEVPRKVQLSGHLSSKHLPVLKRWWENQINVMVYNQGFDFYYDHSGITVVKQLGLLTVLERRDYLILITVFKCLNDLAPHYLSDSFVYVSDVHNRVTRQTDIGDLYVFNATTAYMQISLQYSDSLLWNRLPQHNYQKCHQLKHIQMLMQILAFVTT